MMEEKLRLKAAAAADVTRTTTDVQDSPPPFSPVPSYRSDNETGNECLEDDVSELNIASEEFSTDRAYKEYGFYFTKRLTHMIVCSTAQINKSPLYFVEVSEFTWNKTDVQLHHVPAEIADKMADGTQLTTKEGVQGAVAGVANFSHLSRDFNIALGDPNVSTVDLVFEDVKNASRVQHGQYEFFHTNTHEGLFAKPVKYSWRRTHSDTHVDGSKWKRQMNMNCWKLIDHRSSKVIALVTSKMLRKWKKAFTMVIFDGQERQLEPMIVLTFSAIAEKARRREWKRRMASAGGGGGGGGGG